jgi:hypothetical protein
MDGTARGCAINAMDAGRFSPSAFWSFLAASLRASTRFRLQEIVSTFFALSPR